MLAFSVTRVQREEKERGGSKKKRKRQRKRKEEKRKRKGTGIKQGKKKAEGLTYMRDDPKPAIKRLPI